MASIGHACRRRARRCDRWRPGRLHLAHLNATPITIDEYIAAFPPRTRAILERVRAAIAAAAPDAREVISYRMPAVTQHGILVYFAAFKAHIGLYPPISGDPPLERALMPYAGPKGNLKFAGRIETAGGKGVARP